MDSKQKQRKLKAERFKNFRGNKDEGQGFADKRKRKAKYEYLKLLKKEKKRSEHVERAEKSKQEISKQEKLHEERDPNPKGHRYSKEVKEWNSRKMEKEQRKKEAISKRKAREAALDKYQETKKSNFKKLCRKTYKGQPVMKDRIEMLLSKIESKVNQT